MNKRVQSLVVRRVSGWLLALAVMVDLVACARPRAPVRTHDSADRPAEAAGQRPVTAVAPTQVQRAASATATECRPTEHAKVLHSRMRAEAGEAFAFRKATPLLVDQWPNPTAIVVFTYESRAMPTGRVTYGVQSPEWMLRVSPLGARVEVTHLRPIKKLGREEDREPTDDPMSRLHDAEEALVEVLAGCRTAEEACKMLEPYQAWYKANPVIGRYLTELGVAVPCLRP